MFLQESETSTTTRVRRPLTAPDDTGSGSAPNPPDSAYRLAVASLQTLAQEIKDLAERAQATLRDPAAHLGAGSGAMSDIALASVPRWHFAMLNDTERNSALVSALESSVPPGSHVLDIGSGTGLLAMAAVRAGAGRVTTCELNPLLAEVARQIIDAHGMSDTITVIGKPSTELVVGKDIDARADVLVSEIVDCGLIGEGLLPSIRHAREHLLAPDGIMLPATARLYGQLVQSESMARLNRVDMASGFDVSLMNSLATPGHFPVRLNTWPHQMLSGAVPLVAFDLEKGILGPGARTLPVAAETDGLAHALVVWFELDLGATTLCNGPDSKDSHWMQALVPFELPVPVTAGEKVPLRLSWSDYRLSVTVA
ncbi:50S ribosomal protein L11 methyltransferase [Streptomyces formicae]|uniref:Protein arginine N-methyltransferase 1 n=1 Tax=Streptomyces formicae TaxID=1616117 RepID=A0A291Q1Y4_9ACTN|nr:50S ribosomal protein L11 methyltransferase [Streptomyces formicae]ATL25496.1 Protein arginine N-methyltransferase 1 [Streptomyces formicae]